MGYDECNTEEMVTRRQIASLKRRTDRGGVYVSYLSMLFTGGTFLKVFGVTGWWWYAAGAVTLVVARYVLGYLEEKRGILGAEQKAYSELNPQWTELMEKVDRIEEATRRGV